MAPQKTLLGLALGAGLLMLAGAAPEPAQAGSECCTPPPPPCCKPPAPPPPSNPPCCTPGHGVKVPPVNVTVAPTVVVNANASAYAAATAGAQARAGASGGAGTVIYYGGGGGGGYYSPPVATGVIQGLNVEGGARKKKVGYEASRTLTRRVVIQAVCVDDRQAPHPAAQVFPERDVRDLYDGELFRCVAGTRLQATIAEYLGDVDFSGGQTLVCAKNEALYHAPGGQVTCRPQKPGRDCNERSLLRRFGVGVKILTMVSTETYTAYREEMEAVESSAAMGLSLDGGVGGTIY